MRILYILDYYAPHIGGVEILFEYVARAMVDAGHDVTVLTSRYDPSLPHEENRDGVHIVRVGHNRYDFMGYALWTGVYLARDADIIHTTTYNAAIPASLIGLVTRTPVILTVHELFGHLWYRFLGWRGWFFRIFERVLFFFPFDRYIADSEYTRNSLRTMIGMHDSRLTVIYCGIDEDFWNPDVITPALPLALRAAHGMEDSPALLYFGRAGISKGLEYFIASLPTVFANIPDLRVVLIVSSDDPRWGTIEDRIFALGIEDRIIHLENLPRERLREWIASVDTVVVPSLAEGFGFAAAETCALGIPLVTTSIGSLPEVVSGRITFAEPASAESLADAILRMMHGEYIEIPRRSFSWEVNIRRTMGLYEPVIRHSRENGNPLMSRVARGAKVTSHIKNVFQKICSAFIRFVRS